MSATDSQRAKQALGALWVGFFAVGATLMYQLPGQETIPYHLIWASFALLYGLFRWSRLTTWVVFATVTGVTGVALVEHAASGVIGWEECSEIVLMGVLVALLIWHVDRQHAAQQRLAEVSELERRRAHDRDVAARFGSHQVRTRLTIARGFAELMRDGAADDLTRNDAAVIVAELDKASAITTQLLTLVRVQASSPQSRVEPVDVDALLDGVVHRWASTFDRRWSCSSEVGVVTVDPERLEAALDCLIENATKFTRESDEIAVEGRLNGPLVTISVQDSGSGIPEQDLERVTQAFETGSTAGARAGSGLGLSIAQAVLSAHGGRLDIASTVGVGTRVTCVFPRVWVDRLGHGQPVDERGSVTGSASLDRTGEQDTQPGRPHAPGTVHAHEG
ncbi:MAG: HAMP domain-containing sensor histidine kinase [Mycobacteriales bacterium]